MAARNDESKTSANSLKKPGRPARPPSARNCAIYERVRLEGQTHERIGAEYAIARQTVEAEALMRLVDQSIPRRRDFRLTDIDQLLFGNKIIGA